MRKLLVLGLVGFVAQLIDGGLGMGYGVTSTSMLLVAGISPALASASVHFAELGTNLVAGVSHHRLRNVDWKLVVRLGIPGAIGAFAGATTLSRISSEAGRPLMAAILAALGVYIVLRFALRPPREAHNRTSPHRSRFLAPLGLLGGFIDATGGGGWGPVSTTSLLSAGRTAPRTVIGSVDTSEFVVSLAASTGFVLALGSSGINPWIVLALLAGGVLAAPIAAWLVSWIPTRIMGVAVGGFIVLTNLGPLLASVPVPAEVRVTSYTVAFAGWIVLVALTIGRHRLALADAD